MSRCSSREAGRSRPGVFLRSLWLTAAPFQPRAFLENSLFLENFKPTGILTSVLQQIRIFFRSQEIVYHVLVASITVSQEICSNRFCFSYDPLI